MPYLIDQTMEYSGEQKSSRATLPATERVESLITIIGGCASVLVGIGYCYHFAYFRTFNATWLLRELSIAEMAFGSVPPVLLLVSYAFIAQIVPRLVAFGGRRPESRDMILSPRLRRRVAALLIGLGIFMAITVLNLPTDWFATENRIVMLAVATASLAFGSAMLGQAVFYAMRRDPPHERDYVVALALWFVVVGLVTTPAMLGVVVARGRIELQQRGNCAVVQNGQAENCWPIVYAGAERVYCFSAASGDVGLEILAFEWSKVRAIRTR